MTSSHSFLPLHHDDGVLAAPHHHVPTTDDSVVPPNDPEQQQQQQRSNQNPLSQLNLSHHLLVAFKATQQRLKSLTHNPPLSGSQWERHHYYVGTVLVAAVLCSIAYVVVYSLCSTAAFAPQPSWFLRPSGHPESSDSVIQRTAGASTTPSLLTSSGSPTAEDTCSAPIGVKLPPSPSSTAGEPVTVAPEWIPRPDRFLMLSCTNGQTTNRLLCLQTTVLAAILLNRTLLIPEVPLCIPRSSGKPVVYSDVLDIGHMSKCFGDEPNPGQPGPGAGSGGGSVEGVQPPPRRVMTTADLFKSKKIGLGSTLVVDKFLCGQVQYGCTLLENSCGDLPPQIKISNKEVVKEEFGSFYDLASKIAAATASVHVLAIGDLFFAFFKIGNPGSEFFWPSRFFNTQCQLLFRPTQPVLNQAAFFIEEYLGRSYASIHLRRTDFLDQSHRGMGVQYWSLQDVADCTAAKMLQVNVTNIFVSSDASDEEVAVFKEQLEAQAALARAGGKAWSVAVIRLPKKPDQPPVERAMVDKLVAAHAMVTLFTHRSTFSHHIGYFRESLGLSSCHDGYICQGRPRAATEIKWPE
ncbi:hypothetical protein CLOM_g9202 [Closterium sp. NIES-68]|nr:hypothetical protein CLOM_g9202 [Closterium sp. NIES-68]